MILLSGPADGAIEAMARDALLVGLGFFALNLWAIVALYKRQKVADSAWNGLLITVLFISLLALSIFLYGSIWVLTRPKAQVSRDRELAPTVLSARSSVISISEFLVTL